MSQEQTHEIAELKTQIVLLKGICAEQKKVLENCIVYTIEEYFDVKCEKVHNGKQCGQPIRTSRIIRDVTFNRQKAIAATKDKPNWSYVEHRVT